MSYKYLPRKMAGASIFPLLSMNHLLSIAAIFFITSIGFGQNRLLVVDSVLVKYDQNAYYQLEIDSIWITKRELEPVAGIRGRKNGCIFEGERKGNLPWNGWSQCYGPDGKSKTRIEFFKDGRLGTPVYE